MSLADVTLRWSDQNKIEQGYKIYRNNSPMDVNNMPVPIAVIGKNSNSYIDPDKTIGETYYYIVSSFINGHELYSQEVSITVDNCGGKTINEISINSPFTVYWRVSKDTCFQDYNSTIPVVNNGDPVLSIKDASGTGITLKLNNNNGAYYIEDPDGDYVQYDIYRDFYTNLPVSLTYPWTMGAWMDNRNWGSNSNNHNYISIANPNSSVDQVMIAGIRNDNTDSNDNPSIATNIGGFISKFYNTNLSYFSMVAVFDETTQFSINEASNLSGSYSRNQPNNAYVLSVGALRRSTYTASESTGRLKTLFISNYNPTTSQINDIHAFNSC